MALRAISQIKLVVIVSSSSKLEDFFLFSFFNLFKIFFFLNLKSAFPHAEVPPGTALGPRLGPRLAQGFHAPTLQIALGCHG